MSLPRPLAVAGALAPAACWVALAAVAAARGPDSARLPGLDPAARIVMRTARVTVDLAKVTITNRPPLPEELPAILAKVTCDFEMLCRESRHPETTFAMAFPVGYDEDVLAEVTRAGRVTGFAVDVDGQRPEVQWRRWETTGPDGQKLHYQGYAWRDTMRLGIPQRVRVDYSMLLPVFDDTSGFTYILRSAAGWHGPLGRETVLVRAAEGLRLRPVDSWRARCVGPGDRSFFWDLRNTVPHEDVHVRIALVKTDPVPAAPARK